MSEEWAGGIRSSWWSMPPETAAPEQTATPSVLGSLVSRRSIYTRNGVAWLSARAWSHKARQSDVAALRAAKRDLSPEIISGAADDVADLARMVLGAGRGWLVSTVAVGHSRRPDSFAVRLAQAAAERLDLPFEKLFADRFVSGVSHPKEFSKLAPLNMLAQINQPVILVDDVATSGWHIEEALSAIRQSGMPAIAVVWISGTVK